MTIEEFREGMNSSLEIAKNQGKWRKDSNLTHELLCDMYRTFDAGERQMADKIVVEWSLSDDMSTCWIARALIKEFKIDTTTKINVKFVWVRRIVAELSRRKSA